MNTEKNLTELVEVLKSGGVAVVPTDTMYGVVGLAQSPKTVSRIHEVKKRSSDKPFIVLISDLSDLDAFGVDINDIESRWSIGDFWPGNNTLIFEVNDDSLEYLHLSKKSIAFRLPGNGVIKDLIALTGPLVAPSANPQGCEPAKDVNTAMQYFGDTVDYYFDGGLLDNPPSRIYIFDKKDQLQRIR